MATKDENGRKDASEYGKKLGSHPEPARIGAHHEAERLEAHKDEDDVIVPAVTADVDETPKVIRYGAAVLLGLAFGIGCYVWYGGVPSAPQNPDGPFAGRQTSRLYQQNGQNGNIPAPFGVDGYGEEVEVLTPVVVVPDADGEMLASAAPAEATQAASSAASPVVVYLFAYDSSNIPENADLTKVAKDAVRNGLTLDVKAYTDEHGRLAYNKKLSDRRAKAVAKYLVAHGVPVAKVNVKGMGPTHAYANDAQDRRAEVYAHK